MRPYNVRPLPGHDDDQQVTKLGVCGEGWGLFTDLGGGETGGREGGLPRICIYQWRTAPGVAGSPVVVEEGEDEEN